MLYSLCVTAAFLWFFFNMIIHYVEIKEINLIFLTVTVYLLGYVGMALSVLINIILGYRKMEWEHFRAEH